MAAYAVWVVVVLVAPECMRGLWCWGVWSFFWNRRGLGTFWFGHYSSFMIIDSFILKLFGICILRISLSLSSQKRMVIIEIIIGISSVLVLRSQMSPHVMKGCGVYCVFYMLMCHIILCSFGYI